MKNNFLICKVYGTAVLVVGAVLLFICLWLGYDLHLIAAELATSAVISAPAFVSLHLISVLLQRVALSRIAAWMLVFASIPLLALVPAVLFVKLVPGNMLVLAAMGMLSSYAGILSHGISIAKLLSAESN